MRKSVTEACTFFQSRFTILRMVLLIGIVAFASLAQTAKAQAATLWSWGFNGVGQLGDGTTSGPRLLPIQASAVTDAIAVVAGNQHNFEFKSDGTLWAWGWNGFGQLGDGTLIGPRVLPVQVFGLTNAAAVAGGFKHSLASTSAGTVWGWGDNSAGQLGDTTLIGPRVLPVQVFGLTNAAAVAAGEIHSLALKSDGTVWAWGSNSVGQLGNGSSGGGLILAPQPLPVQVSGLTNAVVVAAGRFHSLAVKSDGTVWAWGSNSNGQIGNGTTGVGQATPVQVSGLTNVIAVAAGDSFSLALKSDGTVWAWGVNTVGQLGNGTTTLIQSTVVQVSGLTKVISIDAGTSHSLALKSDGTVWAWGSNNNGQLGDGTTTNRSTPVQVSGLLGVGAISAGQVHSLALQSLPLANAGADQNIRVGQTVTLDGSTSSDPAGFYPLRYAWTMVSRPAGSSTVLSNANTLSPSFLADQPGNFSISLVVTNAQNVASKADSVVVSTTNTRPVADAGPDQALTLLNSIVQLDGSHSYDIDGNPLTFHWRFLSVPVGSNASLSNTGSTTPSFMADVYGNYVVELTVSDAWSTSDPDTVTVSFGNLKPVANAGNSQSVNVGDIVLLNGSSSSDPNGDSLTYLWSFVSRPVGSIAVLNNANTVSANFQADVSGTFVLSLLVNDGLLDSDSSNATVVATSNPSAAIASLRGALTAVNGLSQGVISNLNLTKPLGNKINAAIDLINQGRYKDAVDKLQNDVLGKTDGCATIGHPDANDWILSCASQSPVYSNVLIAIGKLMALL